jgi:glycine/D-amino acid oxidase-like deaminating enzyme
MERFDAVVVGGGQAGLVASRELSERGVDHVVLERSRIGQAWRDRWDSFCLVTPNWSVQLPGYPYDGDDPDGFMPRDEIVSYLERYAAAADAPVREGTEVVSLEPETGGGFAIQTSAGALSARSVIVATGAYQRPHRPPGAGSLPVDLAQIDVDDYRNEGSLPDGDVLVIGSGQSGCQVAEELVDAGRRVALSCGRAPWLPRRFGGRDVVWWAAETGFLDVSVGDLPSPEARLFANILSTGRDGGHDLNLRTLRARGVTLLGHFLGAHGGTARFAPDLAELQAWGDQRYRDFRELVRGYCARTGVEEPELPDPPPFDGSSPETIDLGPVGVVIHAGGFRPDYGTWLYVPEAFDDVGFPLHDEGASTVVPGLYFLGVHFLRKRKSSIFWGIGEDAAIVAERIAGRS